MNPSATTSTETVEIAVLTEDGKLAEPAPVLKIVKSDEEWRQLLPQRAYEVARKHGTEFAFSGAYHKSKEPGVYSCVCCDTPLFAAKTKFDSGTGWPSYWEPIAAANVATIEDRSYGMVRTEVLCRRCDAHLGHVFPDGPEPTGLRYCINSAALQFHPAKD